MCGDNHAWPDNTTPVLQSAWSMALSAMTIECERFIYLFTYSFIYLFTHTFSCLLCYLLSVLHIFSVSIFCVLIVYFTNCADFGLLPWKISMKKLDNPSNFSLQFVLSWKRFYKPHCLFLTLTPLHSVLLREFFPFV